MENTWWGGFVVGVLSCFLGATFGLAYLMLTHDNKR